MPAIATTADGAYVYLALEDGSGNPVIARAARSDLSAWEAVYEPGAGSAANVAQVPSDPDKMLFYGNFGTDVVVLEHTVSTGAESDISPASLAAKVVNTLAVDPSNADKITLTVDTDQDLLYTLDGGSNWSTADDALGFDATAAAVLWSGDYSPSRLFAAGQVTGAAVLYYSPNAGASWGDYTGSMAATDVVALATTEENQL